MMDCRSAAAATSRDTRTPVRLPPARLCKRQEAVRALALLREPLCTAGVLGLALTSVAIAFMRLGSTPRSWCLVPLLILLAMIAVFDLRTKIIPDVLTLPGIAHALVVAALMESPTLAAAVLGAVVGGGVVLLMAVVSRGAIGGGDIKLAAMLGAALGWKSVLAVLALSQVAAAVVAIILLLAHRARRRDLLPVGAVISLIGMFALIGAP
jgi:leader peptidase (prepilin peptidase) / N-methyltransferase